MANTPRWNIPYPLLTDGRADVPLWMHDMGMSLDDHAKDDQGILSTRPVSTSGTPGRKGRYYFVVGDPTPTNNGVLWRDNGAGWDSIGYIAPGAVGGVQLADNAVHLNHMADDSVGAAEIIAGAVGTSEVADNSLTALKLVDAIVPSRGAIGSTEALRALGTSASQAAAGNDPRFLPQMIVATSVSNLNTAFGGSPPSGAKGRLRLGASPFDFLDLVYDSTYAHWVSDEHRSIVIGTRSDSEGTTGDQMPVVIARTALGTSHVHGGMIRWREFADAGLTLQFRVMFAALNQSGGAETWAVKVRHQGVAVGGAIAVSGTQHGVTFTGTNTGMQARGDQDSSTWRTPTVTVADFLIPSLSLDTDVIPNNTTSELYDVSFLHRYIG